MTRTSPLAREAVLSAAAAASCAALLAWFGPPGADEATHAYQRALFLGHGLTLWNNFWYAGRYSFVTYSLLYYPLAGLLGIRLLAVAAVSTAALAFAVVVWREWGPTVRWSSRTFSLVWAGTILSAAFPFALGAALALLAIWALQAGSRGRFVVLTALTLAASPVAFLLLSLVLAGVGIARWRDRPALVAPAVTLAAFGAIEALLWRLFPGGRYPFSPEELAAAVTFCVLGASLTWRVDRAGSLRWVFVIYLAACLAAYVIPSALGENVARLRYAAVPIAVLALSLRRWRPLPVCLGVLVLATSWNLTPLAWQAVKGSADPAARAGYWEPAIAYMHAHLRPSYRVEAVDTADHWAATYLAEARIPLARGGFRQDDFPQNELLYDRLTAGSYLAWLRGLGVRYVLLTNAPPDYSARREAGLLRSGRSGLRPVFRTSTLTVFSVPHPRPILTGPAPARVVRLYGARLVLGFARPGRYRLAVRYSPYWEAKGACLARAPDDMTTVAVRHAGRLTLGFDVDAGNALAVAFGSDSARCDSG